MSENADSKQVMLIIRSKPYFVHEVVKKHIQDLYNEMNDQVGQLMKARTALKALQLALEIRDEQKPINQECDNG